MASLSQSVGKLDEASRLPLYQQLQRALRQAIETRVLGPDDALPPERDLAADFNVSRITVRKAIDGLVNEGLLVRRQGSGTFVRTRVEKNFSKLTSFSEDMRARGRNPRSVWLRKTTGTVTVVKQEGADKYSVAQTVTTEKSGRTMALDPKTKKIYLPAAQFGERPAPTADNPHPRPKMVPGTFHLVVLSPS